MAMTRGRSQSSTLRAESKMGEAVCGSVFVVIVEISYLCSVFCLHVSRVGRGAALVFYTSGA